LKRAIFFVVLLAATAALLASCGSGYPYNTTTTTDSHTRAFVSNSYAGALDIVDYTHDVQLASVITVGTAPEMMVVSDDRSRTMVFDSTGNTVSIVDNKAESSLGSITLPDFTDSMDISPDNTTAYIAVKNAPVTGAVSGQIFVVDLTSQSETATINIPLVRQMALNTAGTFIVAMSDGPVAGAPQGEISIVDTTKKAVTGTITPDTDPAYATSVDRPIQAIFSSDGSKAYIINCGPECGGTTASVSVLDMTTGHMVPGSDVPLQAASVALLDGNTLYVAGNVAGVGGVLTPVTVNGSTLTAGTPVAIGNGFHRVIGLGNNNKLFIGASGCTNDTTIPNSGCLSIFDTSTKTAVVDNAKGFVTGMDAVPKRNVMYVIEGGELRVYDTTTSAEVPGVLIDIFGAAYDVKIIDK
jgi:hypothetical protein